MKITHRSASTAQHTPGVCFGYAHRVCVGLVVWGLMAGAVLGGTSPAWAKEKVEEGWYPFSFPEKLDPDSPANVGKLVLDAPAGKHGFVTVKAGHFYFEDGTRAKFWGTNLVFNACFPDKKQAEMLADRIAFFGFNAVRLHHMDWAFEPKGIFEDIAPMYKDPQMKETGTLSKIQLDRLDYLIYLLKQRGIYVDMNLLVSRHFTKADGIIDADKLGAAAKPASMFDPKLIELQKQYAKDLLTHYNPYTKLRYVDDPAMALVEIINETSISRDWKNNKLDKFLDSAGYYSQELDKKWNEWLKKKYKTPDRVRESWGVLGDKEKKSGTFTFTRPRYQKELIYASEQMRDTAAFYQSIEKNYFAEMMHFLRTDTGVKAPITGSQYSNAAAQESCDFIDKHSYWDHPKFPRKPWDINDFTIHNRSMLAEPTLGMVRSMAKTAQQSPKGKPLTITEWNHCYPNIYAYETPILMAATAQKNDWDGLFQFAFTHSFNSALDKQATGRFFDIISNPQQLLLNSMGAFIQKKASQASLSKSVSFGILHIDSPYVQGAAGAIREKTVHLTDVTIEANQNGAVFVCAIDGKPIADSTHMILVATSAVTNSGSRWQNKLYDWGSAPTLLKQIEADVTITTSKASLQAYTLDEEGKRNANISALYAKGTLTIPARNTRSPWLEISDHPSTGYD